MNRWVRGGLELVLYALIAWGAIAGARWLNHKFNVHVIHERLR